MRHNARHDGSPERNGVICTDDGFYLYHTHYNIGTVHDLCVTHNVHLRRTRLM